MPLVPLNLSQEWKAAKTNFEGGTKKKKPSEKFLGVFRKGTGIDAALKKADAAKTAGDLRKALADFKKEALAYTDTLKKAAADPKNVKPEDKKVYIDCTVRLEADLNQLLGTGEAMAVSLDGGDKKAKVDPKTMKQEVEAAAALELRKKMEGVLKKVLADYKNQVAEVDQCVDKATQQTAEAKKKHLARDSGGAMVAIGAVDLFKTKAEGIVKAIVADWEKTAKGEMFQARSDIKIPEAWPQDRKTALAKESNDAFGKYDAVQVQIQSVLNTLKLKIANINLIAEEAQGYTNQAQDPKTFVARLAELNKDMGDLAFFLNKKIDAAVPNIENRKKAFVERANPKDPAMLKTYTQIRDAEVKAQAELETRTQRFVQMVKRATLIPPEMRTDQAIAPAFKQFSETANKVKGDLAKLKGFQTTLINDMNGYIKALTP